MDTTWHSNKYDLIISAIIALFFPFLARLLYLATGALIPMIVYYGLAWGIVIWRRKSSGYSKKSKNLIPRVFFINVVVVGMSLIFAFFARNTAITQNATGTILTGLIWAPLNAASEQLLWIYFYDSWDLYTPSKEQYTSKKWVWIRRIVGILLFTTFIGTIHVLFWVEFLHTVVSDNIFGIIFIILTSVSGYLHLIVWRKSNNMIYTFIPHFLLNLVPLFWTGYSILPFLIK